jgi:hypothetical protein
MEKNFPSSNPIRHLSLMGRITMLLALVGSALSCAAAKPVTADQLDQMLAASHDVSDVQLAAQLSDLVLTERLSAARLSRYEANLPGPRTLQALTVLSDLSAFLDPPAAEMPALARPEPRVQREVIALTVNYVSNTMHQLPNFFATRVTTSFQDNPSFDESKVANNGSPVPNILIVGKPLRPIGKTTVIVLYRGGKEVVRGEAAQTGPQGLTTSGEFGPILGMALLDAAQGNLAWSHWEQGAAGPEAVFRFSVSAEKSHYDVAYCCIIKGNGDRVYYRQFSAYDGEIAIDPSNGIILRLSLKATGLKKTDPIVRANIQVEYGPVVLGGRTYICPLKGIAISLASEIQLSHGGTQEGFSPLQTSLNDITFEQYHLYHASSHIVPADKGEPPP